jgi:hypothetical protein
LLSLDDKKEHISMNNSELTALFTSVSNEVTELQRKALKYRLGHRKIETLAPFLNDFEDDLADFYYSHPDLPWNLDPEVEEPSFDPFMSGMRWIDFQVESIYPELRGYQELKSAKVVDGTQKEEASLLRLKDLRRMLTKSMACFAYIRSVHAYSILVPDDQFPMSPQFKRLVVNAALEDAREALERAEQIEKGYAFPREFIAHLAEMRARRKKSGKSLSLRRWGWTAEERRERDKLIVNYLRANPDASKADVRHFTVDYIEDNCSEPIDDACHRKRLEMRIEKYLDRKWSEFRRAADID